MHVEAQGLVRHNGELVAKAVLMPAISVRNKVVCACVFVLLFKQETPGRIPDRGINIQVSTPRHLVCQRHLVSHMHVFIKAILAFRMQINRVG